MEIEPKFTEEYFERVLKDIILPKSVEINKRDPFSYYILISCGNPWNSGIMKHEINIPIETLSRNPTGRQDNISHRIQHIAYSLRRLHSRWVLKHTLGENW